MRTCYELLGELLSFLLLAAETSLIFTFLGVDRRSSSSSCTSAGAWVQ
jgi:hypothetical protein